MLRGVAPTEQGPASRKYSILVVDDEPEIREGYKALLEQRLADVAVVTAESVAEAWNILEQTPVDLILSDYRMPPTTGLELLTKARGRYPSVTRVLVTGAPDLDAALAAVNEGHIERFVLKTKGPEALVEVVRELRERRLADAERTRGFAQRFDSLRRHE
jgi:DNA-binding NtrC family response regulator